MGWRERREQRERLAADGFESQSPKVASVVRVNDLLRREVQRVRARYDLAQTTVDNRKHWAAADGLSAIAANSPSVRRILRNRSRYEVGNNGYFDGMGTTLANDSIGAEIRLQVRTGNRAADSRIETLWSEWAEAVGLGEKLWTMRLAKFEDGEAFAMLITNPKLQSPVQLDLRLLEADQVSSPYLQLESPTGVDGIEFDAAGNPIAYHVLKQHPGDPFLVAGSPLDYYRVAAENMLHYFRVRRPGQARGIPECTSTVGLSASMRRYTGAVVAAAETAADLAMVIESSAPASGADEDDQEEVTAMETIELEKNQATVLPKGWKLGQARSEQPTTTYAQFKHEVIGEAARPVCMPYNIAAGDSAGYNYASGRLDHQTYYRAQRIERALLRRRVLEPLFRDWFRELALVARVMKIALPVALWQIQRTWLFDGHEHVDPVKEASAQKTRLESHTTTLAREYGAQGLDWEEELEQAAREKERMEQLGLSAPPPADPEPEPPQDADDPDEQDGASAKQPARAAAIDLRANGHHRRNGVHPPKVTA